MLLCRLQLLGTLLCQEEHRRKWRPKRREREREKGGGGWGSEDEKRRKLFSLFFFTILMFQSYNRLNYFFSIKIVWKNPLQTAITFFSLTPPIGSLDYYNRQINLTALIYMCIYIFVTLPSCVPWHLCRLYLFYKSVDVTEMPYLTVELLTYLIFF